MSNIKLKNHYWHAQSVYDTAQGMTQEEINAQLMKAQSYITPEQFGAVGDGIADDHVALQACLDQGGAILLSREYNIVDAKLVANEQIELVCTADSKIIADPYEHTYPNEQDSKLAKPVLTINSAGSRVCGMRVFSSAAYAPYIDVNKQPTDPPSGKASNRYAIFANADRCVIRDLYGEYCSLIRLGDNNKDFVIDGLYGDYIEIGVFAADAKNVVINNVRINASRLVQSDLYHVFYFCTPTNCTFSNVIVGASGEANDDFPLLDFINSDIFHFNHSSNPDRGGDVIVINATAIDGCFKRFTQVKDNVRAYFVNCTGKFTNTIGLIGSGRSGIEGEPSATFTGCTFTITDGNSPMFGFRCTGATGRVCLRDCKIIDESTDGYLVSGGVVADGCTFKANKWKINVYSASTSPKFVKFHNCVIEADELVNDGISPNVSGFSTEYHNCKFVFDTAPDALISENNASTVLVIGGSVENCKKIFSGNSAKIMVINLPYKKSDGTWLVFTKSNVATADEQTSANQSGGT